MVRATVKKDEWEYVVSLKLEYVVLRQLLEGSLKLRRHYSHTHVVFVKCWGD